MKKLFDLIRNIELAGDKLSYFYQTLQKNDVLS